MSDIVTRLRAALDTVEATVQAVAAEYGDTWTATDDWVRGRDYIDVVDEPGAPIAHIAAYDPAHVLADIAAKRKILDACEAVAAGDDGYGAAALGETTVRLLAEAYGITE